MKIDVVVAYYKHHLYAPFVAQGLWNNRDWINRAYIVNDEPWNATETVAFRDLYFATLMDHEHQGFGLCHSLNQGAEQCKADYILFCEGDEVLPPWALARNAPYAKARRLLCCPKGYIALPASREVADWAPTFLDESDHRFRWAGRTDVEPWAYCSGGHLIVPRDGHDLIGGFDQRFEYGLHDFDYAARWMMQFGKKDSVVFLPHLAPILHFGTGKGRAMPAPVSKERFKKTLEKLGRI